MEADRIDRLILHHRVRVVRAHAEVDLEGGCLSALLRMYRVGLVAGVDRGRAADGASRDAQAGRQSWLGPPRGGWRRVEGDVRGVVGMEFQAGCAGGVPQRVVGGEVNGAAEESEAEWITATVWLRGDVDHFRARYRSIAPPHLVSVGCGVLEPEKEDVPNGLECIGALEI